MVAQITTKPSDFFSVLWYVLYGCVQSTRASCSTTCATHGIFGQTFCAGEASAYITLKPTCRLGRDLEGCD